MILLYMLIVLAIAVFFFALFWAANGENRGIGEIISEHMVKAKILIKTIVLSIKTIAVGIADFIKWKIKK